MCSTRDARAVCVIHMKARIAQKHTLIVHRLNNINLGISRFALILYLFSLCNVWVLYGMHPGRCVVQAFVSVAFIPSQM